MMRWPNPGVDIWDLTSRTFVKQLPGDSWAHCAFSPDSRKLTVATASDTRLWEVDVWKPGPQFPAHLVGNRNVFAFSPDGHTIACVTHKRLIHLLDAKTLDEFAILSSPSPEPFTHVAFNSDGSALALSCLTRMVQLWDLRSIRRQLAEIGLDWESPTFPSIGPRQPLKIVAQERPAEEIRHPLPRPTNSNNKEVIFLATTRLLSNPLDYDALYHRGWAQLNLNRLPQALADLSVAVTLNPELFDAYHQRGHVLDRLNRRKEAIPEYTKALIDLSITPTGRAHLHLIRGQDHWAVRTFDAALDDFNEAQRLNPEDARCLGFVAWWHGFAPVEIRSPANALTAAERAIKLAPDEPMNHVGHGALLFRLGRFHEATAALEKALAVSRGRMDGFALFLLAMCHHQANKLEAARDCFDRAERWTSGRPSPKTSPLYADLQAVQNEARRLLQRK
jgi:tetratricopeptide (TPR) repeat protein